MANQASVDKQSQARAEGAAAYNAGIRFEANPYPKSVPYAEQHVGPLRGAWEAGWYEAEQIRRLLA